MVAVLSCESYRLPTDQILTNPTTADRPPTGHTHPLWAAWGGGVTPLSPSAICAVPQELRGLGLDLTHDVGNELLREIPSGHRRAQDAAVQALTSQT